MQTGGQRNHEPHAAPKSRPWVVWAILGIVLVIEVAFGVWVYCTYRQPPAPTATLEAKR